MCELAQRFSAAMAYSLFIVLVAGCRGEVPAPASPARTISPTNTTASTSEAASSETPFKLESDFSLLVLDQFEAFGAETGTWKATADGFACSGKPRGYLYSKQPFQNFTLRLEYRFPRPDTLKEEAKFKGNTGFLVYITGEHKLWPTCLEVQGKHVQVAAIKENGGAQPVTVEDDDEARQRARQPVGRWNAIEIISKAGELQVSLNGTPISKSQPDFLSEGAIGVQSEDHPFEIRRMRIRSE